MSKDDCNTSSNPNTSILEHTLFHHSTSEINDLPQHKCPSCNLECNSENSLQLHVVSKHSHKSATFPCPFYDDTLSERKDLESHIIDAHKTTKDCQKNIQTLVDKTECLAAQTNSNISVKQYLENNKTPKNRAADHDFDVEMPFNKNTETRQKTEWDEIENQVLKKLGNENLSTGTLVQEMKTLQGANDCLSNEEMGLDDCNTSNNPDTSNLEHTLLDRSTSDINELHQQPCSLECNSEDSLQIHVVSQHSQKFGTLPCPIRDDTLSKRIDPKNHIDAHKTTKDCQKNIQTVIDETECLAALSNSNSTEKQHLENSKARKNISAQHDFGAEIPFNKIIQKRQKSEGDKMEDQVLKKTGNENLSKGISVPEMKSSVIANDRLSNEQMGKVDCNTSNNPDTSTLKNTLLDHSTSDINELPQHKSPSCNLECNSEDSLQIDVVSQHPQKPATLSCPLCDGILSERNDLENHIINAHKTRKEYVENILTLVDKSEWLAYQLNLNSTEKQHLENTKTRKNIATQLGLDLEMPFNKNTQRLPKTEGNKIEDQAVIYSQVEQHDKESQMEIYEFPKIKRLICNKCGDEFKHRYMLKCHEDTVHKEIVSIKGVEKFRGDFERRNDSASGSKNVVNMAEAPSISSADHNTGSSLTSATPSGNTPLSLPNTVSTPVMYLLPKKRRRRKTHDQVAILQHHYEKKKYPNEAQYLEISKITRLSLEEVKNWFNRRRGKQKQILRNLTCISNFQPRETILRPLKPNQPCQPNNYNSEIEKKNPVPMNKINRESCETNYSNVKIEKDLNTVCPREEQSLKSKGQENTTFNALTSVASGFIFNSHALSSAAASSTSTSSSMMPLDLRTSSSKSILNRFDTSFCMVPFTPIVYPPPQTPEALNLLGTLSCTIASSSASGTRGTPASKKVAQVLKELKQFFETNAYPNPNELERLSDRLSMSTISISEWFQAARQKKHME